MPPKRTASKEADTEAGAGEVSTPRVTRVGKVNTVVSPPISARLRSRARSAVTSTPARTATAAMTEELSQIPETPTTARRSARTRTAAQIAANRTATRGSRTASAEGDDEGAKDIVDTDAAVPATPTRRRTALTSKSKAETPATRLRKSTLRSTPLRSKTEVSEDEEQSSQRSSDPHNSQGSDDESETTVITRSIRARRTASSKNTSAATSRDATPEPKLAKATADNTEDEAETAANHSSSKRKIKTEKAVPPSAKASEPQSTRRTRRTMSSEILVEPAAESSPPMTPRTATRRRTTRLAAQIADAALKEQLAPSSRAAISTLPTPRTLKMTQNEEMKAIAEEPEEDSKSALIGPEPEQPYQDSDRPSNASGDEDGDEQYHSAVEDLSVTKPERITQPKGATRRRKSRTKTETSATSTPAPATPTAVPEQDAMTPLAKKLAGTKRHRSEKDAGKDKAAEGDSDISDLSDMENPHFDIFQVPMKAVRSEDPSGPMMIAPLSTEDSNTEASMATAESSPTPTGSEVTKFQPIAEEGENADARRAGGMMDMVREEADTRQSTEYQAMESVGERLEGQTIEAAMEVVTDKESVASDAVAAAPQPSAPHEPVPSLEGANELQKTSSEDGTATNKRKLDSENDEGANEDATPSSSNASLELIVKIMDQAAASSKDSLGSKKSKKRKGRNKRRALPVTSALSDIKTGVSRKSYFGKNSKFNVLQKHSDLDNNASTVPGSLKSTNDDLRAVMRDESLSKNSHTTEASVEQNDAVEAKASLDENSMMLPMDILTQLGKPKHKKGYETGSSPLMHSRKKRRLDIQGRSKDTELSSSQRMVNEIRVQALGESANNKVAVFAANDDTSKASRFKQEQMFGGHIKRDSPLKTISKRRLSSVPQFATVVPFASSP